MNDSNMIYVDSNELYNTIERITKNIYILKDTLIKIDSYINNIDDDTVWTSPGAKQIKEKYINEKTNYQQLFNLLSNYVRQLLTVFNNHQELKLKENRLLENLESIKLWEE